MMGESYNGETNGKTTNNSSAESRDDKSFEKIESTRGTKDGLFRACMKAIRSEHVQAQRLRQLMVVAGVLTDATIYREALSSFYVLTSAAERKLEEMSDKDELCKKICLYKFRRTDNYEKDLRVLFGGVDNWRELVDALVQNNPATVMYLKKISDLKSGHGVAGVLFVLWGALILGGGAMTRNRIRSLCGPDAIHVYDDINFDSPESRKQLQDDFYLMWDSLALPNTTDFDEITKECSFFMEFNSKVLSALANRVPWWKPYVTASAIALFAILFYWFTR